MKFLIALLIHWISDFLFQSREMAKQKSQDLWWLLAHLSIILLCMLPFGFKFSILNALIHGIIDWNIWKIYRYSVCLRFPEFKTMSPKASAYYTFWEDSWFYAAIGLDQTLHVATIYCLLTFLK